MKKYFLLTLIVLLSFILISFTGFGQELPKEKTPNHQQISGTNIFMIPPNSFKPSDSFQGFQNPIDPTSMIMVTEIPAPYTEIKKGFNAEMLKSRGMELKTKKEINVAGFNGLLIELDQAANGMVFSKQILIYGNEQSTTFINGVYLKDATQLGKQIKESILTTVVDADLKSDPRAALDYTLDESVGGLKFKTVISNGMLFNRDLKIPTESIDKATLITGKSFAKVEIKDKKQFCISRLQNYPDDYSVIQSKGINEVEIDNLKGFELFAKNKDTENEEVYQVILFNENGEYYLFLGSYLTGNKDAISDIKHTIQTFSRKK